MYFTENEIFDMTAEKFSSLDKEQKDEVIDRITEYDADETIVGYIQLLTYSEKFEQAKSLKNHLHILMATYPDMEEGHLKEHVFRICDLDSLAC